MLRSTKTLALGFRIPAVSRPRRGGPSFAWTSSSSLAASKVPTVEVSPADHGTTPMPSFTNGSGSPSLDSRLVRRLRSMNITKPTAIQSHALPLLLNNSYDVMASSATGSGKTLMFALPLLEKLMSTGVSTKSNSNMGLPSALIISPTRELAGQTAGVLNSFTKSEKINVCLATGGSDSRNQRQQLPRCNVLVGKYSTM